MINHCGRHITHLSDTNISFILYIFKISFVFWVLQESNNRLNRAKNISVSLRRVIRLSQRFITVCLWLYCNTSHKKVGTGNIQDIKITIDFDNKGQGHSGVIFILDTPPCLNTCVCTYKIWRFWLFRQKRFYKSFHITFYVKLWSLKTQNPRLGCLHMGKEWRIWNSEDAIFRFLTLKVEGSLLDQLWLLCILRILILIA